MTLKPTYAAIVVREYGEGRICIHTDNIGAIQTGHHINPRSFWRGIFEWTAGREPSENIKVGLVISRQAEAVDRISSFNPITVKRIDLSDIALGKIGQFDLLYFNGLPASVSADVSSQIEMFVEAGGGVII